MNLTRKPSPSGGGSAPPLTAYLTRALAAALLMPLSLNFTALPAGNANGVAGLTVLGGTATLGASGLTVDAQFSTTWNATQLTVADLRGGTLSRTVEEGQTYLFGARDPLSGWQVTLWSAGGQYGSNDEFGFINAGQVRPRGVLPIPTGRRHIELALPPSLAYGQVVEVRRWADGTPRPAAPTASFVIGEQTTNGPDPANVGPLTVVGFNSIGGPAVYRDVQVTPLGAAPQIHPEIEQQALLSAAWVPRRLNGLDYAACIAQGNPLESWVTGNPRPGWVVTTPAGADYASRVALYVDGKLKSVRECPVGVETTLYVDLPDAKRHLLSLIVSGTHEGGGDSKLWDGVHGVYVRRLEVGSGSAEPPPEERRQGLVLDDSTGAGIVLRGRAPSGPVSQPAQSAGELSWPASLARRLGISITNVSFGGQGLMKGGNGGVPVASAALGLAMGGQPLQWRNGAPTDIWIGYGANDAGQDSAAFQAAYRAYIAQVRALYPLAQLYLVVPHAGQQEAAIRQVGADTGCPVFGTSGLTLPDGTHGDEASGPLAATQIAQQAVAARGAGYWDGGNPLTVVPVVLSLEALLPGQAALLDNGTDPPRWVRKRLDGTVPPLAGEAALGALTARVGTLEAQSGGGAGIYLKTDPGQGFTPSDRIVGDAGNFRTVGPVLAATSGDRTFKRVRIPLRPFAADSSAIGKTLFLGIINAATGVVVGRRTLTITAGMTEGVFEGPFVIPAGQQHGYVYGVEEGDWNSYLYLFYGNGSAYGAPNSSVVSLYSDSVPPPVGGGWGVPSMPNKHRAIICEADGVEKNVRGPLDPSDFPVVTSLDQLLPSQAALLDNGTDPPRLARRRLDGSVPSSAAEVELAALRAILPLPRVGIRSVLPRVARDGSEGDAWTYAPIARNTDPVGNWAPDLAEGWVTVPRTGVYTVSVTYVLICNGSQAYNIVLFSDQAGEKMKVVENRADGAVGGTAAGIIQAVAGERFRLGFRTGASAYLYDLDLNHWTVRQEAD